MPSIRTIPPSPLPSLMDRASVHSWHVAASISFSLLSLSLSSSTSVFHTSALRNCTATGQSSEEAVKAKSLHTHILFVFPLAHKILVNSLWNWYYIKYCRFLFNERNKTMKDIKNRKNEIRQRYIDWKKKDKTQTDSIPLLIFLIGTMGVESSWVHSALLPPKAYCASPGWLWWWRNWWNNWQGNRSTRRKPAPVRLCPPQIPHAARTRTRAAAVGSQQLTAWATARPIPCLNTAPRKRIQTGSYTQRIRDFHNKLT
jgi:hypothetical protein